MQSRAARAAQVAAALAATVGVVCLGAAAQAASLVRAPSCAGDGAASGRAELSLLASLALIPYAGAGLDPRRGDVVEGDRFVLRTLRFAACGRMPVRVGALLYDVAYEPWDSLERARTDASAWGRFTAAELGWTPFRWLTVWGGIHKVAFSYAHDEPEGVLALPFRPLSARSIAPDRRLGGAMAIDFLAVKLEVGVYESQRELAALSASNGILVTAHGSIEPIGPVGPAISTVGDTPFWRARPRFGVDLSALYEWSPEGRVSNLAAAGALPFKWGPLGLVVEYLYDPRTVVESPALRPAPRLARQGVWAEAALLVARPYLELAARYEWLDERHQPSERQHALTVGLTGYGFGIGRVQAIYSHKFLLRGLPDADLVAVLLTLDGGVGLR